MFFLRYGLFTGDPYLLFVEGDACVVTSDEDSFQYFVEQAGQNIYSGVVGDNDIYVNFDCTCNFIHFTISSNLPSR